jgi:hypothetical protein
MITTLATKQQKSLRKTGGKDTGFFFPQICEVGGLAIIQKTA